MSDMVSNFQDTSQRTFLLWCHNQKSPKTDLQLSATIEWSKIVYTQNYVLCIRQYINFHDLFKLTVIFTKLDHFHTNANCYCKCGYFH